MFLVDTDVISAAAPTKAVGRAEALDWVRAASSDGRRAIAALESRYRDSTGVPSLKIRHNAVLGYHIEVAAKLEGEFRALDEAVLVQLAQMASAAVERGALYAR